MTMAMLSYINQHANDPGPIQVYSSFNQDETAQPISIADGSQLSRSTSKDKISNIDRTKAGHFQESKTNLSKRQEATILSNSTSLHRHPNTNPVLRSLDSEAYLNQTSQSRAGLQCGDLKAITTQKSLVRDMKVDARVSSDKMPTSVVIQKSLRAQKALMRNMADGWRKHPKLRVQDIYDLRPKIPSTVIFSAQFQSPSLQKTHQLSAIGHSVPENKNTLAPAHLIHPKFDLCDQSGQQTKVLSEVITEPEESKMQVAEFGLHSPVRMDPVNNRKQIVVVNKSVELPTDYGENSKKLGKDANLSQISLRRWSNNQVSSSSLWMILGSNQINEGDSLNELERVNMVPKIEIVECKDGHRYQEGAPFLFARRASDDKGAKTSEHLHKQQNGKKRGQLRHGSIHSSVKMSPRESIQKLSEIFEARPLAAAKRVERKANTNLESPQEVTQLSHIQHTCKGKNIAKMRSNSNVSFKRSEPYPAIETGGSPLEMIRQFHDGSSPLAPLYPDKQSTLAIRNEYEGFELSNKEEQESAYQSFEVQRLVKFEAPNEITSQQDTRFRPFSSMKEVVDVGPKARDQISDDHLPSHSPSDTKVETRQEKNLGEKIAWKDQQPQIRTQSHTTSDPLQLYGLETIGQKIPLEKRATNIDGVYKPKNQMSRTLVCDKELPMQGTLISESLGNTANLANKFYSNNGTIYSKSLVKLMDKAQQSHGFNNSNLSSVTCKKIEMPTFRATEEKNKIKTIVDRATIEPKNVKIKVKRKSVPAKEKVAPTRLQKMVNADIALFQEAKKKTPKRVAKKENKDQSPLAKESEDQQFILVKTDSQGKLKLEELAKSNKFQFTKLEGGNSHQSFSQGQITVNKSTARQNLCKSQEVTIDPQATFYGENVPETQYEPDLNEDKWTAAKITYPRVRLSTDSVDSTFYKPVRLEPTLKQTTLEDRAQKLLSPFDTPRLHKPQLAPLKNASQKQSVCTSKRHSFEREQTFVKVESTLETKKLDTTSPLQLKAKKNQKHLRQMVVAEPISQLKMDPEGIVTNAVRQSSEYLHSQASHDYQRERKLFGKTLRDIQAMEECRLTSQFNSNCSSELALHNSYVMGAHRISELKPQASLHSYQTALGLYKNSVIRETQTKNKQIHNEMPENSLLHGLFNSEISVAASQGDERKETQKSNSNRATFESFSRSRKPLFNLLDTQQVDSKRVQIERINNVLEAQYERKNSSLERLLHTQIQEGFKKHIGTMRNGKDSFLRGLNWGNFTKKQLAGHRKGQMLEKLKQIHNLAYSDSHQLDKFISAHLKLAAEQSRCTEEEDSTEPSLENQHCLPAIGQQIIEASEDLDGAHRLLEESLYSIKSALNGEASRQDTRRQQDSEIQRFERRNKLLAGIQKNMGETEEHLGREGDKQVVKQNDRFKKTCEPALRDKRRESTSELMTGSASRTRLNSKLVKGSQNSKKCLRAQTIQQGQKGFYKKVIFGEKLLPVGSMGVFTKYQTAAVIAKALNSSSTENLDNQPTQ